MIDSSLKFTEHVSKVRSKAFMRLRLVNRLKKMIPASKYFRLVNSLVLSNTEYCASLLYGAPQSLQQKVQDVLNASFRSVNNLKKYDHISRDYKDHGWLSFHQRTILRLACITFTAIKKGVPSYLSDLLEQHRPSRELRSSDRCLFTISRVNTQMGSRGFSECAASLWNSLPDVLKSEVTLSSFKSKMIEYLLSV